ncbi:MAG: DUF3990 domain-containing protein [Clostridium sp.]
MRVYHGSYIEIDTPKIIEPNRPLDFGTGFYVTSLQHQADRWAIAKSRIKNSKAIVSVYNIDINEMKNNYKVKVFDFANEEWLDMIEMCRKSKMYMTEYDAIIGEVADDKVYDTINLYLDGLLPKELALKRIKYKYQNDQICIINKEILDRYLKFENSYEVK